MKRFIFLLIYNLLLPVFLVISIPGYLIKMKKRGGFGTGLSERFGIYRKPAAQEPRPVCACRERGRNIHCSQIHSRVEQNTP